MTTEAAQAIEQLHPGGQVCLLYETQAEHLAVLSLFHRKGLAEGARSIHIADDEPTEAVLEALKCAGVEVGKEIERGALRILAPEDLHLWNETFDPDTVIAFWQEAVEDALHAGFSGIHVSGDMTRVLQDVSGAERLGEYEAKISKALPGTCMRAIYCYSRRLLPAEALAPIFRTHPRVIFGDEVLHPDLLVRPSQNGKPAQDWLEVLLRRLRQSEDALRDALGVKERLFEVSPAAIYTCDADGRITSFNHMAAQLWGREPKIGDPDQRFCGSLRLYWPDGRFLPHSGTPMAVALRDGKPCENGEVIIERPDGSRITVLVNIVPLKDTQGKITGAINNFVDITSRKQAEAMLRQRTHEYYRLLENLPAAAYTCDAEGLITYFNPYAVQVWGREPKLNDPQDRFCGSFRLFLPDGSPIRHDQCWMALALQTGQAQHGREIVIERPDGSRATALAHAHPFHDDSGKLTGAVNVLVDITDREQAEVAKARLAAIVEFADDAIVSKDLNGVITSWNRSAERVFGYTAQEAIGQPITMLMPPDRIDEEPGILERIRRGECIDHYETVRRRKDGTLLDISLTVSPIKDARGQIVGASKIARDITERKRMEEALAQSEEWFRLLLERGYDAVVVADEDAYITYVSPSAHHVLGYGPEELLGKSAFEVIHQDDQSAAQTKLMEILREPRGSVHVELRVRHKDGSWKWFEITWTNLLQEPSVRGIVSNFHDITERRQALQRERELRIKAETAQAQLEATLQEKEVLLREVHHRVKNNMQAVASLLELQTSQITDPQALQMLTEARTRVYIMGLVHQRLYAMEGLQKIDLGPLLEELAPELVRVYKAPNQNVSVFVNAEHIDVVLDFALTCGLLTYELVSNALKHAFPEGGPGTVQVTLNRSKNGGDILLQVSDDGIGMPENFNLRSSPTLGMELIHSLARQVGGSVLVDTGNGTAFTITFSGCGVEGG